MAGRNFPSTHSRDCSEAPTWGIWRAHSKASAGVRSWGPRGLGQQGDESCTPGWGAGTGLRAEARHGCLLLPPPHPALSSKELLAGSSSDNSSILPLGVRVSPSFPDLFMEWLTNSRGPAALSKPHGWLRNQQHQHIHRVTPRSLRQATKFTGVLMPPFVS